MQVVLSEGGGNGEGVRGGMGLTLPVIVFVLTKMLTLPGKPPMQVRVYQERHLVHF